MKETTLEQEARFKEETTEHSMNDAYRRVTKMGKRFTDITIKGKLSFGANKRQKMLKQMVAYFEENEEFEKCFILMEILGDFNIEKFSTESYK
jgi:hypothetical protein